MRLPSVPAGALLVAGALACSVGPDGPARPHLLLVTIDTLRADHLSSYGHERPTSPRIDELAASGVVFEDAQAHASWTLPTMASLMTGHLPSTHGCWTMENRLDDSFVTLAELLADAGFVTGGVPSHTFVGSRYGLGQGFDALDEELVKEQEALSHRAITSAKVTAKAETFLRRHAGGERPFFLWLHYFDPHERYLRHEGIPDTVRTPGVKDVSLYDGEIRFTDGHVGRVLDLLDELEVAERTVVVLTADHGEEFRDHGGLSHGSTLYREVVRVPLVLRAPGFEPRRVAATVRIVDVLPTVLELLELPAPGELTGELAGESLVPAMRGAPLEPRAALAELRLRANEHFDSLTTGRWKLIATPDRSEVELYDRETDPEERSDVAGERPDVVAELLAELEERIADAARRGEAFSPGARIELSDDERKLLDELGYTGE